MSLFHMTLLDIFWTGVCVYVCMIWKNMSVFLKPLQNSTFPICVVLCLPQSLFTSWRFRGQGDTLGREKSLSQLPGPQLCIVLLAVSTDSDLLIPFSVCPFLSPPPESVLEIKAVKSIIFCSSPISYILDMRLAFS